MASDWNLYDATAPGSSVPPGMGNSAPNSPTNVPVVDGEFTFGYMPQHTIPGKQDGESVSGRALFTTDLTSSGIITHSMTFVPGGEYPYFSAGGPDMGNYTVQLSSSAFRACTSFKVLTDNFQGTFGTQTGVNTQIVNGDTLWLYVPLWLSAPAAFSGPLIYSIQLLSA
jgi:hypothetical protein